MNVRSRVLITDGDERAALALVRSLGRAGFEPYVCARHRRSLAGASRFARDQAAVADPLRDASTYVADLQELVRRWQIQTVVPVSEAAILAVLPARAQLQNVHIPLPELDTFRRICDKQAVLEAAAILGIAVPRQHVIATRTALDAAVQSWESYPVVIKPARSVNESAGQRVKLGVSYADSADALRAELRALPDAAFPVLLQQRIVGPGVGIFLLLRAGEIRARFAHRRIREKPPAGGVSVYRESIAADSRLVAHSHALLTRFGWEGVAMVEYKVDAATGTPYLMEVNGRFWGSLQLAIDAGVDFPALLMGAEHTKPTDYRIGVRSRWWWGDVDQLLTRLRRSRRELALPPDAPSRARALLDFLMLWRPGDRNEILRWTDPLPFVRETAAWFGLRK